jgi:hypothetical protein
MIRDSDDDDDDDSIGYFLDDVKRQRERRWGREKA